MRRTPALRHGLEAIVGVHLAVNGRGDERPLVGIVLLRHDAAFSVEPEKVESAGFLIPSSALLSPLTVRGAPESGIDFFSSRLSDCRGEVS